VLNASVFSAKVLIPSRAKAPHVGDQYRIGPEFRIAPGLRDVDVRRFDPLQAEEEKPISPYPENRGHSPSLPCRRVPRERLASTRHARPPAGRPAPPVIMALPNRKHHYYSRSNHGCEAYRILTGGGDVPGLNSVIKTVVYRGSEIGCEVIGIRRGWEG